MRGRPILAAIFVALTAFVLSIPLRNTEPSAPSASEDEPPSVEVTNGPGDEPTPEETGTPEDKPADELTFSGSYPEECLLEVSAPEDDGHLAIDQEKGIEITDPSGGEPILVEDKFPFKWSPSGTFLAAGNGAIYDSTGRQASAAPEGDGPYSWAWSPIADCLLVSSGSESVVVVPGSGTTTILHDAGLSRFSFSPGGGDLAFGTIGDEKTLWVASLADGRARRLKTFPLDEGTVVVLAGWTPNADHVLFWRGQSSELLAEGVPLYAVSFERKVSQLAGAVLAHRDFVTTCGNDVLGVVGSGARVGFNLKHLARLEPGREPQSITPEDAHDVSPSCSPEADFIALIRSISPTGEAPDRLKIIDQLTIIDQEGAVVFQPSDTGYKDAYPLWGRGDSGVLFIRKSPGQEPEVWHVTTDSPASPTGATLRAAGRDPDIFRDGWGHFLDWSADQPSGVSVVSGGE